MIRMFMGIENLPDTPAELARAAQANLGVEGIDHERFETVRASNQIMKVAALIGGPDTFDQHGAYLGMRSRSGTAPASRRGSAARPCNNNKLKPRPVMAIIVIPDSDAKSGSIG
jgi:hypothetical protein